jgi:hypothetical protein
MVVQTISNKRNKLFFLEEDLYIINPSDESKLDKVSIAVLE